MDLSHLQIRRMRGSVEMLEVSPGLNLTLYIPIPVPQIAPYALSILEKYLAFVPEGSIKGYQASDGGYDPLTKVRLKRMKSRINNMRPDFEYFDLDLSSKENGWAGDFAFHFKGNPLNNQHLPLETNQISLEFPADFSEKPGMEAFVIDIFDTVESEAAWFGLAFNHSKPSDSGPYTRPKILAMASRYQGVDVDYPGTRNQMKGKAPNVNWYTFINHRLVEEFGGVGSIRDRLGEGIKVSDIKHGVLIKAGEAPPLGDVQQGATDVVLLKKVAKVLKPKRYTITGFGTPNFDAMKWLARFDDVE